MNIKDLKPNEYHVVSTPTNINQLQPGSYSVVDQAKPKMPLLTNEKGGFGTALKDVATGAAKSFISGGRDVASLAQSAGKGILGAFGADTSNMGIRSIDDSTPEGAQVAGQLQSKSRGEQVGSFLENAAELGAGFAKDVAPAGKKIIKNTYTEYKEGKNAKTALKSVTPRTTELAPTEYEDLLRQGKIAPKTMGNAPTYLLSESEKSAATKYKNLLQSKDPVKNSINVMSEIGKKDAEVGNFLRKNNGIFNKGELKNHILSHLKDVSDVTIDPSRVENLKSTMTDGFIKALKKNDMESLWEARKAFDKSIEKVFNGSPSLQNTVKKEFRNAIQEFIAQRTPEGVYKGAMKDMRELFNIQETLAGRAAKEKNYSKLGQFMKDHPNLKKVLGWGTAAIGTTATGYGTYQVLR